LFAFVCLSLICLIIIRLFVCVLLEIKKSIEEEGYKPYCIFFQRMCFLLFAFSLSQPEDFKSLGGGEGQGDMLANLIIILALLGWKLKIQPVIILLAKRRDIREIGEES